MLRLVYCEPCYLPGGGVHLSSASALAGFFSFVIFSFFVPASPTFLCSLVDIPCSAERGLVAMSGTSLYEEKHEDTQPATVTQEALASANAATMKELIKALRPELVWSNTDTQTLKTK